MYFSILQKYIQNIKPKDIKEFGKKYQIHLSEKEITVLYEILKKEEYLHYLLEGKEEIVFKKYENQFQGNHIERIKELFYTYKNKFF